MFKTGNSQKTTPSNASSSIHSLLNKLKNVKSAQGTVPPVHLMSIDVLYAVNTKKEATDLIEPELSSQSDVSLTASKISISDLLDYVNRDWVHREPSPVQTSKNKFWVHNIYTNEKTLPICLLEKISLKQTI